MSDALTTAALEKLRGGFDADRMTKLGVSTVAGYFAGGAPWLKSVDAEVYRTGRMAPIDRERVLIALFTGQAERAALAIHVYWGLMEGLTPQAVHQIVLLAGTYTGLGRYTFGTRTTLQTFARLAACAAELESPTEAQVVQRLLAD